MTNETDPRNDRLTEDERQSAEDPRGFEVSADGTFGRKAVR